MQFLGSLSQSMSQRYLSHANQPIGGVLISPLSRAKVATKSAGAHTSNAKCIPAEELIKDIQMNQYCEEEITSISFRNAPPEPHLTGYD